MTEGLDKKGRICNNFCKTRKTTMTKGANMSINIENVGKTIERNKNKKTLDASITVRVDDLTKSQFEDICSSMGITVSSAISAFINKVINIKGMPFAINTVKRERKLGVANGKYDIPDDINALDDEIAEMFGV